METFGKVVYEGRQSYWGTRGHWEQLTTEDKCAEEAGAQALLHFLEEQQRGYREVFRHHPPHD